MKGVSLMFDKLINIKTALNQKFFEREEEIEGMLLSLLSRQHMLLIGEPGTAKSYLATELSKVIDGGSYFQWLLTKYTTPEELFGALKLEEFEKGIHARNTDGKLPEAHLVFLDEIFKSNSAILNSLLTLINERLFYNNGTPTKSPLVTMIGASNEYPEEEGLEALFDRLLLRYEVKPVKDRNNRIKIRKGEGRNVEIPSLTLSELRELQFFVEMVNMPDPIHEVFDDIYIDLLDEGINISQRRTDQSVAVLKAKAFIEGRNQVEEKDLMVLKHILWNEIEEKELATEIVKSHAYDKVTKKLIEIEEITKEIVSNFDEINQGSNAPYEDGTELTEKLKGLREELDELKNKSPHRSEEIEEVSSYVKKEHSMIVEKLIQPVNA